MQEKTKVWDPAVRLFHWALVLFFTVSYLTGETGSLIHVYSGYVVLVLLLFRFVWGLIGTRYARFGDFVKGPAQVWRYTHSLFNGNPIHYQGHNPLGGWMVLALLLSLALSVWSGLELYATEGRGPLAGNTPVLINTAAASEVEDEGGHARGHETWEEVHEAFANLTLLLVMLHIIGVPITSRLHRENLVKAMITGYKNVPPGG
jgi:cytochrome b